MAVEASGSVVSGEGRRDPSPTIPLTRTERVASIDVLRGVAVLGILLMNIPGFGMPFAFLDVPVEPGGNTGANLWVWAANSVLFAGKMRAIFSMLFGAGVLVLTSRLEDRGAGIETADIYLRRLLWLVIFGLVHAYFIWWGDILFFYGVIGLFLFPFRKLSGRTLIIAGIVVLLVHVGREWVFHARTMERTRADAVAADTAAAAGATPTSEQKAAQESWANRLKQAHPAPEALEKEIAAYRGSYLDALRERAGFLSREQANALYSFFFLDAGGMMLLGMGLFKLGFLSAAGARHIYWIVAAVGFALGLPLAAWAVRGAVTSGFDPVTMAYGDVVRAAARVPIALAHVAVVMLICQAGILGGLTRRLGAVGQMAFSNYILTSLICTTVFYGYGVGLFGYLQRYQIYYVVAAVWLVQLVVSPIWLRHFRFGPLEWLWRSLTYLERQPLLIRATKPVTEPATV
jgi:uncharacterized protein